MSKFAWYSRNFEGMIPKELLIELVQELDDYCKGITTGHTMDDFVQYLYFKRKSQKVLTRKIGGEVEHTAAVSQATADDLGRLLGMLNRYAKYYLKMAFANSVLQTPEEFTYLMVLFTYNKLPMTELIRKNIMEKTSGLEVIKRLIRMGLIEYAEKSDDKRAKPIAISNLGRDVLLGILPQMRLVGEVVAGNLTEDEQRMLVHLMSKLDYHHHKLYDDKEKAALPDYLYRPEH